MDRRERAFVRVRSSRLVGVRLALLVRQVDDLRKARDAVGVGSKTELEAKAEEIRKNESRPSASVRIARINEWARRFT